MAAGIGDRNQQVPVGQARLDDQAGASEDPHGQGQGWQQEVPGAQAGEVKVSNSFFIELCQTF